MAEDTNGAISGAASGAAAGAAFGPWGAVIGGVVGGIGGFIGGSKAKKRRQQIEQQIAALTQKIGQSVRGRMQSLDKFTEDQKAYADQMLQAAMAQYAEMKLQYNGLYERNSAQAEQDFAEEMAMVESSLQEELGIQADVLQEYNASLDEMYQQERDFIQADLAHNNELKEEFKTNADQAIKDTWEASTEAKIDLQQLKDSGGRPESFDRVVAENAKAFGDIQNQIDRQDAGRGRSDLTGKKMTAMFQEAMNKGNISGQMAEYGQRQEQALRGEVADLGDKAMRQSATRTGVLETNDGQILAEMMNRYKGTQAEATMRAGLQKLDMVGNANEREMVLQQVLNDTIAQLALMRDQGLISAEEFKYESEQAAAGIKQEADNFNWQYKDNEAKSHEAAMRNTISSLQGQGQQIKQDNKLDVGKLIGNVASAAGAFTKPSGDANAFIDQEGHPSPFVSQQAYNPSVPYGPVQAGTKPSAPPSLFGFRK